MVPEHEGDDKVGTGSLFPHSDKQHDGGMEEGPCFISNGTNDLENVEGGVFGDDDVDMYNPSPIQDDLEARSPVVPNGKFHIYMCLVISAVVIGTIGAVLGITLTKNDAPPSIPYRGTIGIRENIARFVSDEQLADHKSAYYKALDWIMFDDPVAPTPDKANFVQRYLLAYFYFATSMNKAWENGCAPAPNDDASCKEKKFVYSNGGEQRNYTTPSFRWFSSVDECKWAGIDCDQSGQIRSIELSGNGITGTFPEGILHLPFLQRFSLIVNELEGTLPEYLWKYKYLHDIDLSSNYFNGTIPDNWFKARTFGSVVLESNEISGTVSKKLLHWKDISVLVLNDNLLEGTIPDEVGTLMNIVHLAASRNNFNGTIPKTIGKLQHIEVLDLSQNKVTGNIPTEIGNCRNFVQILLYDNLLTGAIPDGLWRAERLYSVDLSNNNLNGTISGQIGKLSELYSLHLQNNQFSGNFPKRLSGTNLYMIQASGNKFNGTVSDQICDLVESGQLEGLEFDCATPPEGGVPDVICPCCTLCCAPNGQECYPPK